MGSLRERELREADPDMVSFEVSVSSGSLEVENDSARKSIVLDYWFIQFPNL